MILYHELRQPDGSGTVIAGQDAAVAAMNPLEERGFVVDTGLPAPV
jgi:hypothetical protein